MNNITEYRTATDNIRFTDTQKEQLTAALVRSAAPTRLHPRPLASSAGQSLPAPGVHSPGSHRRH